MAAIQVEDVTGVIEAVCFTDNFTQFGHLITTDAIVFILGRLDHKRGQPQIIIDRIVPIDGVPLQPGKLRVLIPARRLNGSSEPAIEHAARVLAENHAGGPSATSLAPETPGFPLELVVETERGWAVLQPDAKTRVAPTPKMVEELCRVLGAESEVVGGVTVEPADRRPKWQQNGKQAYAGAK
jgi:hypothetical protein